jgi:DNA repair ATPase RecN
LKPLVLQTISKTKNQDEKFEYLAENIDNVIIELAEIFPILAYKLSGKHNIKERLNKVDEYFNEVESLTDGLPFDIKEWINPKFTKELLEELDKSIKKIAKKTDAKTIKSTKKIIQNMTFEDDTNEMESFIDEYLEKVIQTMPIEN